MSMAAQALDAEVRVMEEGFDGTPLYSGRHALLPVLIGLSAPIVVFTLLDPRALQHGKLVFFMILFAILVVALSVFVLSVLNPGNIVAVRFDAKARVAEFIYQGSFANRVVTMPFKQIAGINLERVYDDDGYDSRAAVLTLRDGGSVTLPSTTTADDVAHIKACLARR